MPLFPDYLMSMYRQVILSKENIPYPLYDAYKRADFFQKGSQLREKVLKLPFQTRKEPASLPLKFTQVFLAWFYNALFLHRKRPNYSMTAWKCKHRVTV